MRDPPCQTSISKDIYILTHNSSKTAVMNSNKNNFTVGVSTTRRIVSKGDSIRKVANHCSRMTLKGCHSETAHAVSQILAWPTFTYMLVGHEMTVSACSRRSSPPLGWILLMLVCGYVHVYMVCVCGVCVYVICMYVWCVCVWKCVCVVCVYGVYVSIYMCAYAYTFVCIFVIYIYEYVCVVYVCVCMYVWCTCVCEYVLCMYVVCMCVWYVCMSMYCVHMHVYMG